MNHNYLSSEKNDMQVSDPIFAGLASRIVLLLRRRDIDFKIIDMQFGADNPRYSISNILGLDNDAFEEYLRLSALTSMYGARIS